MSAARPPEGAHASLEGTRREAALGGEDTSARDAWAEIDLGAIAHNVGEVRRLAGNARVYAVCKGHAYGFDPVAVARVAGKAGAQALAAGDPGDARAIRAAGIDLPILLYGGTVAQSLPSIAAGDILVTAHDGASLGACLAGGLRFSIKLDCGFARLGFRESDLDAVVGAARAHPRAAVHGVYTHLADVDDPAAVRRQIESFARMADRIEAAGWAGLERMVASSRVLIAHPELALDAVNPGRMLYGMLEPPWDGRVDTRPALLAVKARVIAIKQVARGERLGYASEPLGRDTTIAVIPYGFADGYPRMPAGGAALLRNRRVPIIGLRHTEHSILDVTEVPGADVGDEVALLGRQGDERIDALEIAAFTGVPLLELVARLARAANRRYLG